MRVLIQRVSKASVEVDGEFISKINRGLLLFVGVTHEDDLGIADHLARKSAQLRIFEDEQQRQHQQLIVLLLPLLDLHNIKYKLLRDLITMSQL